MSNKKTSNDVTITKNGRDKTIPKLQWDQMVKTKSTYDWRLKSDLPKDVIAKDSQIESSKIAQLEAENLKLKSERDEAVKENEALKAQLEANASTGDSDAKELGTQTDGGADDKDGGADKGADSGADAAGKGADDKAAKSTAKKS